MSRDVRDGSVSAADLPRAAEISAYVERLVVIADRGLPAMMLPSGLCCHALSTATLAPRGESLRYSLITLLGLSRRAQSGEPLSVPLEPLLQAVEDRHDEMGVGDLALRVWLHVRLETDQTETALADLSRKLEHHTDTSALPGLEIAWWVTAAALAKAAGFAAADHVLRSGISTLSARRSKRSPLVRHLGAGWRASFPNFATEVYSLLALAELARFDLFSPAEEWAVALADLLVELRLPDHGWPWLYHAESGSVVEPYEVYSVHQDGMAPMAFFALAEATGRREYAQAALEGVPWCFGHNELALTLVDETAAIVNRSIRRRGRFRHANLYGNTLLAAGRISRRRLDIGTAEINQTCRPYHLGWILEAFSGRDQLVESAGQELR